MPARQGEGDAASVRPGALTALLRDLVAAPEAAEGAEALPRPGTVVGRFELVRELGRGGFGVVYEARDRELGRSVAFKLVRAGREGPREQLLREAETVARLSHPNLVQLFDVGRSEHGPYLVLELLHGETLAERLAKGPVEIGEAIRIAVGVARGVAHAHAEGVVHRDLKPGNVFLCRQGPVKVLDFGLAYAFGRRRVAGGTAAYMAPEQWEEAPEDERTDVFAMGVMLHQLLTGKLPFGEEGRWARGPGPAPKLEVPGHPAVGALVARMLEKNPVQRPRDGAAVLAELEGIERALSRLATPAPAARQVGLLADLRRWRLGPALLPWLLVVAATAAGVAWLGWRERKEAAGAATAEADPSVAVLPFADLSLDKDQERLADGIAEGIMNGLAQVDGLRVIGMTSSFSFKGKADDLKSIGQQLGVRTLVEGSVRRSGTRLRVAARLVRAADGFRIWSRDFDREFTDLFSVEEEISRAVVDALRGRLAPGRTRMEAGASTNPEALEQYLLGRDLLRSATGPDAQRALEAFDKAVAIDPGFARAWVGISQACYWIVGNTGGAHSPLRQRALAAAERAVALAPDLPDGYVARGRIRLGFLLDSEGGRADLDRGRTLGPNLVWAAVVSAVSMVNRGEVARGVAEAERATRIDPLIPQAWTILGMARMSAGDFPGSRVALARALEISPQDWTRWFLLANLVADGRAGEALVEAEKAKGPELRQFVLAIGERELGRPRESRETLDLITREWATLDAYALAQIHAWRGEPDLAFEWLERARRQLDFSIWWVKADPLLARLRTDPRFPALLARMRLPVGEPVLTPEGEPALATGAGQSRGITRGVALDPGR